MRTNTYRKHISNLLTEHHMLSMSAIHEKIADANYSTIYRNVEQMVGDGVLKKIVLDKNDIRYELVGAHDDHDHFWCTDCGDIQAIPQTVRNQSESHLAQCSISDMLVKGLCQDCNE